MPPARRVTCPPGPAWDAVSARCDKVKRKTSRLQRDRRHRPGRWCRGLIRGRAGLSGAQLRGPAPGPGVCGLSVGRTPPATRPAANNELMPTRSRGSVLATMLGYFLPLLLFPRHVPRVTCLLTLLALPRLDNGRAAQRRSRSSFRYLGRQRTSPTRLHGYDLDGLQCRCLQKYRMHAAVCRQSA